MPKPSPTRAAKPNAKTVAERIAGRIFDIGSERGERPHRSEFKLGTYPDSEREGGGLCETALVNVIATVLREIDTEEPTKEPPRHAR